MKKILIVNFDSLFNINENRIYGGINKLLDGIKDEFDLLLLSENKEKYTEDIKTITHCFKDIFYLEDIKKHLPDLYILKPILQKYNITNKETIYIGNDPNVGFFSCKTLGITSIRLMINPNIGMTADTLIGDILCKNIFHAINHVRKYF